MLTQIFINHLITIEEVSLMMPSGTTVITGETGTGKSILLDAIKLGLGDRASDNLIRPDQEKLDINLCFDISSLPPAKIWLKNYDFPEDSHECIIRRVINKDGRSRSYINGMPVTLNTLRELRDLLINIHGQNEHQTLLTSEKQRDILDRYANHPQLISDVQRLAAEWQTLQQELKKLRNLTEEKTFRTEFLTFQLRELEEFNLGPNEFQTLDLEHKQLAHAGDLLENLNLSLNHISYQENNNAISLIHHAVHALEKIQHVDAKMKPWIEQLNTVLIQLGDIENELQHYLESTESDPDRLIFVEQRLSKLYDLARKHKISPESLYDFQCELLVKLNQLERSQEFIKELENKICLIEKSYQEAANKLTQSRKKSSKKLEKEITKIIQELALPHADFQIHFDENQQASPSSFGLEKINFQIKTNLGLPMQPLIKIASGGELSRICLAIHIAIAEQYIIPTLVFDEVDVGISGATAEMVGKLLRKLGKTHQVLCVTHLPQVACQGHHHIRVEKIIKKGETISQINLLSQDEKTHEIARMLGGIEITKNTLAHAHEMIETAASLI